MISKKNIKLKIKKYIKEAQEDMLLQKWSINIDYNGKFEHIAECTKRHREYLRVLITVNLNNILEDCKGNDGDKNLKLHCYHEVAHILTHELEFLATCRYVSEEEIFTERERLSESISKIILNLKK